MNTRWIVITCTQWGSNVGHPVAGDRWRVWIDTMCMTRREAIAMWQQVWGTDKKMHWRNARRNGLVACIKVDTDVLIEKFWGPIDA